MKFHPIKLLIALAILALLVWIDWRLIPVTWLTLTLACWDQ